MARALVVVALLATPAHAQVAGTFDDPLRELRLHPAVLAFPLQPVAVRGLEPVMLVDGFEVPRLEHFLATRGIGAPSLETEAGVAYGGPATLSVDTDRSSVPGPVGSVVELSPYDLGFGVAGFMTAAAHLSWINTWLPSSSLVTGLRHNDAYWRLATSRHRRWRVFASAFATSDDVTIRGVDYSAHTARVTAGGSYRGRQWSANAAVSSMLDTPRSSRGDQQFSDERTTLDSRVELGRTAHDVAGLQTLVWRIGEQSTAARHDIDAAWPALPREGSPQPQYLSPTNALDVSRVRWIPDVAVWSSLTATLAPRVTADVGLRLDSFGRDADLALQPRGSLDVGITPTLQAHISAGAYRRAARDAEAILHDLNPERTTQVVLGLAHTSRGHTAAIDAYYQDLSRLVMRDTLGELHNTGLGRAYGVELSGATRVGHWRAGTTLSLSRALRRDYLRARERPAQFDQPLRVNAFASYVAERWQLSARAQLVSGLPDTPIQQAVYQADTDWYRPIFGQTYSDHLPYHVELGLRADHQVRLSGLQRVDVFTDVLLAHGTLGYADSFDYKQRHAITLPIIPFVGLRGIL